VLLVRLISCNQTFCWIWIRIRTRSHVFVPTTGSYVGLPGSESKHPFVFGSAEPFKSGPHSHWQVNPDGVLIWDTKLGPSLCAVIFSSIFLCDIMTSCRPPLCAVNYLSRLSCCVILWRHVGLPSAQLTIFLVYLAVWYYDVMSAAFFDPIFGRWIRCLLSLCQKLLQFFPNVTSNQCVRSRKYFFRLRLRLHGYANPNFGSGTSPAVADSFIIYLEN
jgi:hypothetical protein